MKAAAHNLAAFLLKIAVRCNSEISPVSTGPHHRSAFGVHFGKFCRGMDLFGNRIFPISIIVRSPYYTSNRKIWQSSYIHQLNHFFRVETTPNFNSNSSKAKRRVATVDPSWTATASYGHEETMLHPNPLRCFYAKQKHQRIEAPLRMSGWS